MYVSPNFKTKKELKAAVASGREVTIFQPGPFGGNELSNGTTSVEGPHGRHTWYARVKIEGGLVKSLLS